MAGTIGSVSYIDKNGMPSTEGVNLSSTANSVSKNKGGNSTTLDVEEFLQLMVAEMQNQDPLEPTDNSQYMAQLATFSQVEATKQMMANTEKAAASDLVGKAVIMKTDQNSAGFIGGIVDYWENIDNTIYLGIDGKLYDIADLDTVMNDDYYKKWDEEKAASNTNAADNSTTDNGIAGTDTADTQEV